MSNNHSGPVRVLVGKLGLDGHDRGAKVVTRILRDGGMEVIYSGLRRTATQLVRMAIDEDVEVIGLSMLSGAHVALVENVIEALKAESADIPIVVGGTISPTDDAALRALGVADVFPVRSNLDGLAPRVEKVARGEAAK